jgi:molybdopterin-guanine dinucleotide biosynthesis protein A
MQIIEHEKIAGVILAGGRSQRMGGGDKGLRDLGDRSMLAHVVARIAPQVDRLAINANGDPARFAQFGLPVVPDTLPDFPGPLAGVLAGMRWAATAEGGSRRHVVTVSSDAPFLPVDLVTRLVDALTTSDAAIAVAQSAGVVHPVIGLWPVALADALERAVEAGERRVQRWAEMQGLAVVPFAPYRIGDREIDPFFNANTPEEFAEAARLIRIVEHMKETE